jgi:uncharacterized membrane protein YsdA (DUF1294 family)
MNVEELIYLSCCCIFLLICSIACVIALWLFLENKRKKKEKIRQETRDYIETSLRNKGINLSHRIDFQDYYSFIVDEIGQKVVCCNFPKNSFEIINFSDLIRCEIIKDNKTYRTGSSTNTALGGILGGAAGAIFMESTRENKTAITKYQLNIISQNIKSPVFTFPLLISDLGNEHRKKHALNRRRERDKFAEMVYITVESIVANTPKQTQ